MDLTRRGAGTNGRTNRVIICAFAALAFVLTLSPRVAAANAPPANAPAKNYLKNGDFARGSGNTADQWRKDAWITNPGVSEYRWIPPANGKPGEVEVITHGDNDARWVQSLSLGPGWYHLSVGAKTVNVWPYMIGANISLLEDGIRSRDLKGTQGWQRLGFYLKIGSSGADIDVALRLGGFMNLSRGEAFFRKARVTKVAAPPPGAITYDLTAIRKTEGTGKPIGHLWTLVATFLALIAIAVVGWRVYGWTIEE